MVRSKQQFVIEQGFDRETGGPSLYNALMFQPRAVGVLLAAGAALQGMWCFLALAALLAWSAAVPAHNPFDAVYNAVFARRVGMTPLASGTVQRRLSASLGSTLALAIAASLAAGATRAALVLEAVFAVAVAAVVVARFCPGAWLYRMAGDDGHAPEAHRGSVNA